MPPKNINDFFSPVSTGTNANQQIDDLILMEELDRIAKQTEMHGAITQFHPDVHAPTVTPFALDAELAPLKAMGWLLGKGKGIKDVLGKATETLSSLFKKGFLSESTAKDMLTDVSKNLPEFIDIERRAEKLKNINKELDELGELYNTNLNFEEYTAVDNRISQLLKTIDAENLIPGAGLTEPYHIGYPHTKSGKETIPFEPIEVQRGYDMTEKGAKEFKAKYGEEAFEKEVSKYTKTQEHVEDLRIVEIEDAYETLSNELTGWTAEEAVKRNISIDDVDAMVELISEFPYINQYIKAERILKELESRGEIRWKQQKTLRDMFEGGPY
jgi:hypothetical protein